MTPRVSFASDNHSPAHPLILEALGLANHGAEEAYGGDQWTQRALAQFKNIFGTDSETFLVVNGTGANVLALTAVCLPYQAVLCAQSAHIHTDETGAPERHGLKLLTVATADGKLTPELLAPLLAGQGSVHHSQARVVSISQSTEWGTVYTPGETRALADWAHQNGLILHVDGARISAAAASLGVSLRQLITDAGVDILSFGGTKNGLVFGEAVVFVQGSLSQGCQYLRKQNLQLLSKMRYLGAQFEALLQDQLYLKNASHANEMARLLADQIKVLPGVKIAYPVQANAVFAYLPRVAGDKIQADYPFYWWDETASLARLMTSWDTPSSAVMDFAQTLKTLTQ